MEGLRQLRVVVHGIRLKSSIQSVPTDSSCRWKLEEVLTAERASPNPIEKYTLTKGFNSTFYAQGIPSMQ